MIYTNNTKKAIKIMFEAHKNQLDKSGMPYVFHPWHVAEQMDDENSTIVALLHDVIEDTKVTIEYLAEEGFDQNILDALILLTHEDGVDYFDYVSRISSNEIATKVKMADLQHNMDLNRLSNVSSKDLERFEKYSRCYDYLLESLNKSNKKN